MKDLEKIIGRVLNEVKERLLEGLSQRLFHFCPVNAMFSIAKTDSFKLTSVDSRPSDAKMTSLPTGNGERKQYQYYMCFSRTPSSLAGYVSMRREKTGGITWKQSLVRMEIDGDKLNANYKGMPVNYFNDKNLDKINHYLKDAKGRKRETVKGRYGGVYSTDMDVKVLDDKGNIRTKTMHRYTPHADDKLDPRGKKRSQVTVDYGVIDRNQMSEYEDRLFSNKPYIKNIIESDIIKRVDIFLCRDIIGRKNKYSDDVLYMVDEIIKVFGDKVHIFDNFSSFEGMNIVNSIDGYDFKKQYLEVSQEEYASGHDEINPDEISLYPSEVRTLVRYAAVLGFGGFGNGWEQKTYSSMSEILGRIGISSEDKTVDGYIKDFINQIAKGGKSFFMFQSDYLKKELEQIPPYKLNKYVAELEREKNLQMNTYNLSRPGKKPIGILSIKANLCK